jgi:gamma-glutamylcyclotransferase (GGCT)/AIG2-like uncharacterized protein YtfP
MTAMSRYLFVYGTLLPDLAPSSLRELVGQLRPIGPASTSGCLYDLGAFPGAIREDESETRVQGEVFELPADPDLLAILDAYEGFDPSNPGTSLFVRVRRSVTLAGGDAICCWVYVYNGDLGAAPPIAEGDYRRWLAMGRREPP